MASLCNSGNHKSSWNISPRRRPALSESISLGCDAPFWWRIFRTVSSFQKGPWNCRNLLLVPLRLGLDFKESGKIRIEKKEEKLNWPKKFANNLTPIPVCHQLNQSDDNNRPCYCPDHSGTSVCPWMHRWEMKCDERNPCPRRIGKV